MNKKVLFTAGPQDFDVDKFATVIRFQALHGQAFSTIEQMKGQFLDPDTANTSTFVRITIEEVDKEGNPNG